MGVFQKLDLTPNITRTSVEQGEGQWMGNS